MNNNWKDKNEYEKAKSVFEGFKNAVNVSRVQEIRDNMKSYKKENKWMKDDDGLKEKYNSELSSMKAHEKRNKEILKGDLDSAINSAKKLNETILPYITGNDAQADLRIKINEVECEKINDQIQKLNDEKNNIPEMIQEHTTEGKKKVEGINSKIEELTSRKNKLEYDNSMYSRRNELMEEYKNNQSIINSYKTIAKKYDINLEEQAQPSNPQPSNPQPSNPQPSNPQPSNPQPSNPQPSNPQPSNPQPSNPQPSNPQPSNPQPSNPQPSNPQPSNPQPSNSQPSNSQPSNPQPKDVKINIGKEVTYSFEKDGQTIEGKLDLKTLKKQLDPDIAIDIARKLRNLQGIKAEDKDYDEKMKKTNELAKKVNPIIFEALYKLDIEIGKDQSEYLINYLKTIIKNDPSMLKTDIVYDENRYKKRSIFDRIKSLSFIDKSLNKKEINKIDQYAEKDENDKFARIIRMTKKEPKKLGNGQQTTEESKTHSDYVKKLHSISQMQIDDPDDKLTPQQIEQKKARQQQESSTDYIDRFAGKDKKGDDGCR